MPRLDEPHLQHLVLDDGPDIEPVALGKPRMRQTQASIRQGLEPRITFVGLERIAAGCNEIDGLVEFLPRQVSVDKARTHLLIQLGRVKGGVNRGAQYVLRQNIELLDRHPL